MMENLCSGRVLPICLTLLAGALPRAGAAHEGHQREQVQLPAELRQKSTLCTDGKNHYVLITPDSPEQKRYTEVYYGDGKRFVLSLPFGGLTRTLFHDPRFYNSRASAPDRGGSRPDYRIISGVKLEDGKCSAWCGERDIALTIVDAAKAGAMLGAMQIAPNPRRFAHHALARDEDGVYYYVDHGYFADGAKNYRLFVGAKRALKAEPILDVTADSEGEIFNTKAGNLLLNRSAAKWKAGGKVLPLHVLPLDERTEDGQKNIRLLYNELGIYKGERLGTPCDDL